MRDTSIDKSENRKLSSDYILDETFDRFDGEDGVQPFEIIKPALVVRSELDTTATVRVFNGQSDPAQLPGKNAHTFGIDR